VLIGVQCPVQYLAPAQGAENQVLDEVSTAFQAAKLPGIKYYPFVAKCEDFLHEDVTISFDFKILLQSVTIVAYMSNI
jgi:hypothetical protein